MSDAPSIVYTPRRGGTSEIELDVLAAAYRFILDRHAEKVGATSASEDATNPKKVDETER